MVGTEVSEVVGIGSGMRGVSVELAEDSVAVGVTTSEEVVSVPTRGMLKLINGVSVAEAAVPVPEPVIPSESERVGVSVAVAASVELEGERPTVIPDEVVSAESVAEAEASVDVGVGVGVGVTMIVGNRPVEPTESEDTAATETDESVVSVAEADAADSVVAGAVVAVSEGLADVVSGAVVPGVVVAESDDDVAEVVSTVETVVESRLVERGVATVGSVDRVTGLPTVDPAEFTVTTTGTTVTLGVSDEESTEEKSVEEATDEVSLVVVGIGAPVPASNESTKLKSGFVCLFFA